MLDMAEASPYAAFAQQQRTPIVGFVGFASPEVDSAALAPFRKAMAELGYAEGRSIIIDGPLQIRAQGMPDTAAPAASCAGFGFLHNLLAAG